MIIFDTETTDLLKPEVADISTQAHIIEIAMVKLDGKYKELDCYSQLLNPGVPLDEKEHASITGLTNKDLEDKPTFLEIYPGLWRFVLGEDTLIAHNLVFDLGMLTNELRRIGKEFAFPYPPNQICTVDRTKHILGHRMKLRDLYERTFKKKLEQTHRALDDAKALSEIVRKMKVAG